jgi:hypothetical protein
MALSGRVVTNRIPVQKNSNNIFCADRVGCAAMKTKTKKKTGAPCAGAPDCRVRPDPQSFPSPCRQGSRLLAWVQANAR